MKTTTTLRTIISPYGNGIAVGLEGDKESTNRAFNRFYNFSNGNPSLHEMGGTFSYFLTTEEELIHALETERIVRWQDSAKSAQFKATSRTSKREAGKRFLAEAHADAVAEFATFERENFMGRFASPLSPYAETDGGAAYWESETED